MAEGEVKVLFRTEADLKGADQLAHATKQAAADLALLERSAKATRASYEQMWKNMLDGAQKAAQAKANLSHVAGGNLTKNETEALKAEADAQLNLTAGAGASTEALKRLAKVKKEAVDNAKSLASAISHALNPMRMFSSMVSGFTRGALFGGMAASFGAMNQEVRQLLNSMFSVVHLADSLASKWIGMGKAMEAVVQSTKDIDTRLRNIDASSRSTEQSFGRTLSIAEELIAAEERMAKVTGETAEQELQRYKRREDLLVKEAEAKASFEDTKLNAEEQVLADLRKARPVGTPETAKMAAEEATKRLAKQQADLQTLYQAQTGTGYDVPLEAMQATERATGGKVGVVDFAKPSGWAPGKGQTPLAWLKAAAAKRIQMLTDASNALEREIQEGRGEVEAATARAADIEAKDAAIKAVEGRVETTRQSRTEAYANRDFARQRRKIRVDSTEYATRERGGYSPPEARYLPKPIPNTPAEQAVVDDELLRRLLVTWERMGSEAQSVNDVVARMVKVGEINAVSVKGFLGRLQILEARTANNR